MDNRSSRAEILDLLARGKINIDEAVALLDSSRENAAADVDEEPVYKAETEPILDDEELVKLKADELAESSEPGGEEGSQEGLAAPLVGRRKPRWLRVQVTNSETGKNKVTVNVPIAMVKFGLSMARVFTPEMGSVKLDEFDAIFNEIESGLLVDVQDDEDGEHVRVFVE